eukprot:NODE_428_length_8761_cov_0.779612.p1 type:complete len:889 gc:universal NODE_428_length_8761_cov_0.779612:2519-5185(+)
MQNIISDHLLDTIGISEKSIVDSLISLKKSSMADIYSHLQTLCYPSDKIQKTADFLQNLFNPVQEAQIPTKLVKEVDVRLKSRQEYLKKRETKQLAYLKYKINKQASNIAPNEMEFNRRVVELIENRKDVEQQISEVNQGYAMPDEYSEADMKNALKGKSKVLGASFDKIMDWEEMQLSKAANAKTEQPDDYDYLFDPDEQIAFLLATQLNDDSAKDDTVDSMQKVQESLPIFKYKNEIIKTVKNNSTTILVGQTGSGKSTQTPQYLLESASFPGLIAVTQPRRVACQSLAARVAKEMDVALGKEVGYTIRFEDRTSFSTKIKFLTDGVILKNIQDDPTLSQFSVIIIDEAHERTTNTDILLGLLKEILTIRKDLKIIISSATLDADKFSKFFDNAPILNVPGKTYPIDVYYTQAPEANYVSATISTIMQIHISQPLPGDILCFLTGQEEIESCLEILNDISKKLGNKIKEMLVYPIYASLPSEQQIKIFIPTPANSRKIVLATNIAETSLTIDGITSVIDCGLQKEMSYTAKTDSSQLQIVPTSKDAANQRAGRAGRTQHGKCYRLYTKWAYENEMSEHATPEINKINLANVCLLLKSLGVDQIASFPFIDTPPLNSIQKSIELLQSLNALDSNELLTREGKRMAELPLDPKMAKVLLNSTNFECSEDVCSIVALLTINSPIFLRPRNKSEDADMSKKAFSDPSGDHLTLLNVYNQFQDSNFNKQWCYERFVNYKSLNNARDVRQQLLRLVNNSSTSTSSSVGNLGKSEIILKSFLSGYFSNICRLTSDGSLYKHFQQDRTALIHPSSSLYVNLTQVKDEDDGKMYKKPKWVLYNELMLTSKEYMRIVSTFNPNWIVQVTSIRQEVIDAAEGLKRRHKSTGSFFDNK